MNKSLFTVALFILVTMLMGLVISVQPLKISHKTNTITDELTEYAVNSESGENHALSKENEELDVPQNEGYADASTPWEATNQQEITTTDNTEEQSDTSSDQNTNTSTPPPDGRIYWSPEPPYAYTPTCTPKEPIRIPITHPD